MVNLIAAIVSALSHPIAHKATRYELVINAGRNSYAAVGYGTFRTADCTVTSDGPAIVENGAKAWITFLNSEGEYEGDCQLVRR